MCVEIEVCTRFIFNRNFRDFVATMQRTNAPLNGFVAVVCLKIACRRIKINAHFPTASVLGTQRAVHIKQPTTQQQQQQSKNKNNFRLLKVKIMSAFANAAPTTLTLPSTVQTLKAKVNVTV